MRRVPTEEPEEGSAERALQARRQGLAYQGAAEAVAAVPIAIGIGYWLDGRFDTSPYLLVTGVAVGFASFVTRLLRLGRQLRDLEEGPGSEPGAGEDGDE